MDLILIGEPKINTVNTKKIKVFIVDDIHMAENIFKLLVPAITRPLEIKEEFKEKRPKKNWEPKFYHQRNR